MGNTARDFRAEGTSRADKMAEALSLVHDLAELTLFCGEAGELAAWRKLRALLGGEVVALQPDPDARGLLGAVADYHAEAVEFLAALSFKLMSKDAIELQDQQLADLSLIIETAAQRIYRYLDTKKRAVDLQKMVAGGSDGR